MQRTRRIWFDRSSVFRGPNPSRPAAVINPSSSCQKAGNGAAGFEVDQGTALRNGHSAAHRLPQLEAPLRHAPKAAIHQSPIYSTAGRLRPARATMV